jgi:hypothetical protein
VFSGGTGILRRAQGNSFAWKVRMRRQSNSINWGNELPLAQGIEFLVTTEIVDDSKY